MRKHPLTLLLLACLLGNGLSAESLYQENSTVPMTGMMLDMMDAFGMVEKVGEANGQTSAPFAMNPLNPLNSLNPMSNMNAMSTVKTPPGPDAATLSDPAALLRWQQAQTLLSVGNRAPWLQPTIPPTEGFNQTAQAVSAYDAVPGFFAADGADSALVEAERHARERGTGKAVTGAVDTSLLDGLWRSEYNEVLMINKGRFIWRDMQNRSLAGYLKVVGTLMIATIPGKEKPAEFFYAISGNYLNVYDASSGRTFSFFRTRTK